MSEQELKPCQIDTEKVEHNKKQMLHDARRWMQFEREVAEAINRNSIDTLLEMPDFLAAGIVKDLVKSLMTYRRLERMWRTSGLPTRPKQEKED